MFKKRKIQTYKMINSHLSTKPSLQNGKLLIEIKKKVNMQNDYPGKWYIYPAIILRM